MPIRDTERWNRLKQILFEAMDLDRAQAQNRLKAECAGDAELLAEAQKLLDIHHESGLRLDRQPSLVPDFGAMLPLRTLEPGRLLAGRFRIERFLGEGGIGEVYEASDTLLSGQRLAVKTLHPFGAAHPRIRERFQRELQLARQVSHPNLCRLHEFAEDGGLAFITMELLDGQTMAARLAERGAFGEAEAAPVFAQLCAGLGAAHAAGVLHRDLKPSNIMLCRDGRVVIMDFGLAAWIEGTPDSGQTLPGSTLGTPAYMSPEQLDGRTPGKASDLYSLGIIAYEMLTGASPHAGLSPLAIAARRVQEPPPSPRAQRPEISLAWDAAIRRALALAPEERFASAAEFEHATRTPQPWWRRLPRRWLLAPAAALALVALSRLPALRDSDPEGWMKLGQISLDANSAHAAALFFQKAIDANPGNVLAHVRRAEALIEQDRYELAKDALLNASTAYDQSWWRPPGIRQALTAARAASQRKHDVAVQGYCQLPDRMACARAQIRAGHLPLALETLAVLTREHPESASAWLRRGAVEGQLGQRDVAMASLLKAEEILSLQRDIEGLAEVYWQRALAGELAQATAPAAKALSLARQVQSPAAIARALLAQSRLALRRGENDQALALVDEARRTASEGRLEELAIQGTVELASAWSAQYRMKDVQALLRTTIQQADALRAGYLGSRARFVLAQAISRYSQDAAPGELITLLDESTAYFRENRFELDLQRVLNWRVLIEIAAGRYAVARQQAVALRESAEKVKDLDLIREADALIAEADDHTGDLAAAVERLSASARDYASRQRYQRAAYAWANAAAGAVRAADPEKARSLLAEARSNVKEPRSSAAVYCDLVEADLALLEDRAADAIRLAQSVAAASQGGSGLRVKLAQSIVARAQGDVPALAALEQAPAENRQQFVLAVIAQRHLQALAAAGRRKEAIAQARRLLPRNRELGHLVEETETRILLAKLTGSPPDLQAAEARWGHAALERFLQRPDLRRILKGL